MRLGAFSISLSVKNLQNSTRFYRALGFEKLGGDEASGYVILKNGNALIGLFQGMFEGNLLTFNPGWDESGENIPDFDDVRSILQSLKVQGIGTNQNIDSANGPASFTVTDPDGNVVLIDQHR